MKVYILFLCFANFYALDFDCLKGSSFWCANEINVLKCGRVKECSVINDGVVKMSKIEQSDYCKLCEEVITSLSTILNYTITENTFVYYVESNVCPKLNSEYKEICLVLLRQYGHEIYTELKSFNAFNVCSIIQLCRTNKIIKSSPKTCKICKEVFKYIETILLSISPTELKAILKLAICEMLPPGFRTMCDNLVDHYTDLVYQLLKSLLDGNRICPALHLCSNLIITKVSDWKDQTCLDVITVLKKDLQSVSINEVDNVVESKVCAKVPELFKHICDNLIGENIGPFMNKIHSTMTPAEICARSINGSYESLEEKHDDGDRLCSVFHLCSNLTITKVSDWKDQTCLDVVTVLKKDLESVPTSAVDIFVRSYICSKVSVIFKSLCNNIVFENLVALMNKIHSTMTPAQICKSSEEKPIKMVSLMKTSKCEMCQFAINETKSLLSEQSMLEKLIKNGICIHSGVKKHECMNSVTLYYSLLIKFVQSFLTPEICTEIHLCGSTQKTPSQHRKEITKNIKYIECAVCKKFYLILKSIKEETINMDIILRLVSICGSYSGDDKRKCLKVLKRVIWLPESVNKLKNEKKFCQMTRMCLVEAPLLLQKQCLVGPSFWCISRRHAQFCGIGAVKHCEFYFGKEHQQSNI